MTTNWEFHTRQRKMPLTTNIFINVLQSSGFSDNERLVREALQNSVDAHRLDADVPVSVRIEKSVLTGSRKSDLVSALQLTGEPMSRRHLFELPDGNALENIDRPDEPLTVLTISDSHTCGLGGRWNGTEEGDHFGRLVVNLGVDDKAEGTEISGGSFGFGKTVYGRASGIGVVAFYSVFSPTEKTDDAHARFMAAGHFKAHEYEKQQYDGFAFFGEPDPEYPDEVAPFLDDKAHQLAKFCGLERRSATDHGTSILILDCDPDIDALRVAAEEYWWPRLIHGNLDLLLIDQGKEIWPRPKQNSDLRPFIICDQSFISETNDPPRSKLYTFQRVSTDEGYKRIGSLSCLLQEGDTKFSNCAALIRGPGMVVNYRPVGSDSFESCVATFHAHGDIDKVLTYAEPQMHDQWDENSDRLRSKFGADGERIVRSLSRRIERTFREFQKMQEPPVPPGGLQPRELSKLLGRFLDVPGETPPAPPAPAPRPIEIHVHEDRVKENGTILDIANVELELRAEHDEDVLECMVSAYHELLGDSSHRVIERSECELSNANGAMLGKGSPASAQILLTKGQKLNLVVRAAVDEVSVSRIKIAVEEVS